MYITSETNFRICWSNISVTWKSVTYVLQFIYSNYKATNTYISQYTSLICLTQSHVIMFVPGFFPYLLNFQEKKKICYKTRRLIFMRFNGSATFGSTLYYTNLKKNPKCRKPKKEQKSKRKTLFNARIKCLW